MKNHLTPEAGTFPYVAPEVQLGQNYDNKADLWSLGIITCELCKCSNYPSIYNNYDREATINSKYDKNLEKLINGLLKRNPTERYDTDEALTDINKLEITYQDNNIFNNENLDEISKNILERKKESEIEITVNIDKEQKNKNIFFLDNTDGHNHFQTLNNENCELFIYNKNNKTLENEEFRKWIRFPQKDKYKIILKIKDKLKDTSYMFSKCKTIINLDLSYFNASEINKMSNMFSYMNLEKIDLPFFNTKNIETMEDMFANCNSLKNIKLRFFNTLNIDNMSGMFRNCKKLESVEFSSSDDIKVKNMDKMFDSCKNLTEVDLSAFTLSEKSTVENIFHKCTNLSLVIIVDINSGKQKFKDQINKIKKEIGKEVFEVSTENQLYRFSLI